MSSSTKCFGLLTAGLLLLAGCVDTNQPTGDSGPGTAGTPDESSATKSTLQGEILIDGSSTVKPIGEAVANRFAEVHPGVRIEVGGRGTGNGFKRFQTKETDISEASRPIKPTEFEKVKAAGIEFLELPVAYDGLTIVINPENDWVKQLTVDQLKTIFVSGAKTWKEVDDSWPAEEIKLFAPGTGSGTYDYFKEVVVDEDAGEKLREDMSLNEDDNALVTGVAGNKFSIGFFGVAYFVENQDKLKAVPIVNPETGEAMLPESEHIESGAYAPFSRPLFIYVNKASLDRAEMQAFVNFYMEEAPALVSNVGYVRLPEAIMERGYALLDDPDASIGTVFVTEDGSSRKGKLTDVFVDENRTR